jgi:hypothetical protein
LELFQQGLISRLGAVGRAGLDRQLVRVGVDANGESGAVGAEMLLPFLQISGFQIAPQANPGEAVASSPEAEGLFEMLAEAAAEQEVVAGPGGGNVEEALLLGQGFAAVAAADQLAQKGGLTAELLLGIEDAEADAQLRVDQSGVGLAQIELAVQIGNEDDGEFQSFGGVDGEDLDRVSALVQGRFSLFILFSGQEVQVGDKIGQRGGAGGFEGTGQREELADVGHGLVAALAEAQEPPGAGLLEDVVEQLDQGDAVAKLTPAIQEARGGGDCLAVGGGEIGGGLVGVELIPERSGPQLCQDEEGVVGEAQIRGAEGAQQGETVAGVVEDAQDIGQVVDLLALVEAKAADYLEGDVQRAQRLLVHGQEAAAAQENGDVAKAGRADTLAVGDRQISCVEEAAETAGDELGFALAAVEFLFVVAIRGEEELDRSGAVVGFALAEEGVVGDLERLPFDLLHKLGEEVVDKGDWSGQGAEVFPHYQAAEKFVRVAFECGPVVVVEGNGLPLVAVVGGDDFASDVGEDGDIGVAEGVDRLLGVADDEEFVRVDFPLA